MKRALPVLALPALALALLAGAPPARAEDEPLPAGAVARLGSRRLLHDDEVLSLAFTLDSKRLVSTSHDGTLRVWDARTGALVRKQALRSPDEAIAWLATDRLCLLAESLEGPARVVALATGDELSSEKLVLPGERKTNAVALSRTCAVLASAATDDTVTLWDGADALAAHKVGLAHQLVFSPDGARLAVVTYSRLLVFAKDGTYETELPFEKLERCAFSADGKTLALVANGEPAVTLVDAAEPERRRYLEGREAHPLCVAFAPDGKTIATGDRDGSITLWDAKKGDERELPRHRARVTAVAVSPDGETIVTAEHDQALHFWRGAEHRELPIESGVHAIAFSGSGSLGVACGDGSVRFVDARRAAILHTTEPEASPVEGIAFASSGTRFATVTRTGALRFWDDRETSREVTTSWGLTAVAIAGARVFTGGADKLVRAWDWTGDEPVGELAGHERALESVVASPDDGSVATLSAEHVVRIFAARTLRQEALLDAKGVTALAYSPDSRLLALGFADGTVRIVDAVTASEKRVLAGHEAGITSLAWSKDGARLISGSRDHTALVWATGAVRPR